MGVRGIEHLSGSTPDPEIVRVDKYTITVAGVRVRANDSQELRIRLMSPEQLQNFMAIMGS